jgi:GNAT superfamily N-acetyltransferase
MNISFQISDSNKNLKTYSQLYSKCFDKKKFKLNYLNWLYNENPIGNFIGIDCFDNENLIGQVGGIPHEFIFNNKKVKFLISINVCVDPKYQGQWIFSKMLKRFEKLAKELNFNGIIGIANKAAFPFWQRSIKMKKLGALDVFLGFGKLNLDKINKSNYNFYTNWNKKNLEWRMKNPTNETYIQSNENQYSVYSKTNFLLIDAYSPLIFFDENLKLNIAKKRFYKPIVYLGLISEFKKTKFLFDLPEYLKPSPLNFVYKFFDSNISLDKKKIIFTFLDFDIF